MNSSTDQLVNPERFTPFNKLIVGFSGGLDSTVLLHALAVHPSLHSKLVVVHVNHGISANAALWQTHCKQFCHALGVHYITQAVHFDRSANIEERARNARYAVFSSLMTEQDCLVLGHHQNDQAETVLLQLFRGAGIDGLAAMAETGAFSTGTLMRPFLSYSRELLEDYAASYQLEWIEDESNEDINYSRNYLRHQIIPLLAEKWPKVIGTIARTATHCQKAKENLDALAIHDHALLQHDVLSLEPLQQLNDERIMNVLRVWLKNNKVQLPSAVTLNRLIHEMIFARTDAVSEVSWGEIIIRRYQDHLYLDKKNKHHSQSCVEWLEFPEPLVLEKAGISIVAKKMNQELKPVDNSTPKIAGHKVLNCEQSLVIPPNAKVVVRFRRGGERFVWHGQTKCLKKLFQEWGIPPWFRERIPLIYINDELAVVIGYAVSDSFFKKDAPQSWLLVCQEL